MRNRPRPQQLDPETEVLGAGMGVQLDADRAIEYFIILDGDDNATWVHIEDLDDGWKSKLSRALLKTR